MQYTHQVHFDIVFERGNLEGIPLMDYMMCKFTSKRDASKFIDDVFINIAKGELDYSVTRACITEI